MKAPSMTTDSELLVKVDCPVPNCLELVPVNDAVQNRLLVTIRQAGRPSVGR